MLAVCFGVFVALIFVASVIPRIDTMSSFELHRRKKQGDQTAEAVLRRRGLLADILSLQKLLGALLLIILVLLLVSTLGWVWGVLVSLVITLEYGAIARIGTIQRQAQKRYEKYEPALLGFAEKYQTFFTLIRTVTPEWKKELKLDSREELEQLVAGAGNLLKSDEQKLIIHGLQFPEKQVKEIMTPRGVIDSIPKNELLGPLVLDDLHKTGHSRFPVIDGDIDHVVGILYIQDLLTVDSGKRSSTVEKTMLPRVFYIRQDQTLDHALAAFLRTHHHLFIVINEFRETVGIVSLEDVIEALLGRKIIDEFDTHEDLRVVAARNPRKNNHPQKREDV